MFPLSRKLRELLGLAHHKSAEDRRTLLRNISDLFLANTGRLSEREREILELLAENLSNREIADRLVIAYTTVKWYNRQIFNKLGVENREQAVERAFALHLLKPPSPQSTPSHNRTRRPGSLRILLTHDNLLKKRDSMFVQCIRRLSRQNPAAVRSARWIFGSQKLTPRLQTTMSPLLLPSLPAREC